MNNEARTFDFEKLAEMANAEGIRIEPTEHIKNGVKLNEIKIMKGEGFYCPVVNYDPQDTEEHVFQVIRELSSLNISTQDFALDRIKDNPENLFVCVQRKGTEPLVKREYLNLEVYIRYHIPAQSFHGSIKILSPFMDEIGLDEDTLWDIALENTRKKMRLVDCNEISGLLDGAYIVTTFDMTYGATALLYTEFFRDFCEKFSLDGCAILPSSLHEVFLVPYEGYDKDAEFRQFVAEQNAFLPETIQLDPEVYHYTLADDKVFIAAHD